MYTTVLISVLVQLICFIFSTNADFNVTIDSTINKNITLPQNEKLKLTVFGVTDDYLHKDARCSGWCDNDAVKISLDCNISAYKLPTEQNIPYLTVNITKKLTKSDNGRWDCHFKSGIGPKPDINGTANTQIKIMNSSFYFEIQESEESGGLKWEYIAAICGSLVILVILGQTICIVHFKKKAKAVSRHVNLTPKGSQIDDTARYSSLPGQKQIEISKSARESGIYETLENVRAVPAPPPVSSLPRNRKEKRSTIERIKNRPPMPIPTEEVYEVMDSPTPPRKNFRPDISEQTRPRNDGFSTQPRMKPRTPLMERGNTVQTLRPQMLPSQLKQALEIRKRANTDQAPSTRMGPSNPGLPLRSSPGSSGALNNLNQPIPTRIPFHPGLPPPVAAIPRTTRASPAVAKKRPIPPPQTALQFPLPPFAAPGLTPHLPPEERAQPGTSVPKWRPPPPAKPKLIHPLSVLSPPPPPTAALSLPARPTDNTVNDLHDDDDDGEWVYESLPKYNIYNV